MSHRRNELCWGGLYDTRIRKEYFSYLILLFLHGYDDVYPAAFHNLLWME